jgi:hypothetical protein
MANTKVKITYVSSGPTVTVSPSTASVKANGRASWEIVQLPTGYTYELDFNMESTTKGPFPSSGNAANPSRGVYVGVNGTNLSLVNDQAVGTSWKYNVLVYDQSGGVVVELDPIIDIVDI